MSVVVAIKQNGKIFIGADSQVTKGGLELNEINLNTFESNKYNNLYILGEALNVDGSCGGFNLHFAWASAYLCAQSIINK